MKREEKGEKRSGEKNLITYQPDKILHYETRMSYYRKKQK